VYEAKTKEGTERVEVYVTNETKTVMGIATVVVWDRVWLNGELIEDTKDWFAQDKEGNVWYFGEDSKEMINGQVSSTKGSWEAGVNGAQPGIIMKANPKVGDSYRQEYYKGEAEDMAEVVALGAAISVPYGTFTDCLQTKEWNPLEQGGEEYKYYCPKVGNVVLEAGLEDQEKVQLITVTDEQAPVKTETPVVELKKAITEDEAKQIAVKEVPGRVTDSGVEKKFRKSTWVIEIQPDGGGPETDVIIDMDTGEVLDTET